VFVHLDVDGAPPDLVFAGFLVDDTLVFGGSARLFARKVDQGAGGGDDSALISNGVLIELSRWSIALELDLVHVETGLGEVFEIAADKIAMSVWGVDIGGIVVVEVVGRGGGRGGRGKHEEDDEVDDREVSDSEVNDSEVNDMEVDEDTDVDMEGNGEMEDDMEDDWEMAIGKIYERTIGELGKSVEGPPIGIITNG